MKGVALERKRYIHIDMDAYERELEKEPKASLEEFNRYADNLLKERRYKKTRFGIRFVLMPFLAWVYFSSCSVIQSLNDGAIGNQFNDALKELRDSIRQNDDCRKTPDKQSPS